MRRQYVGEPRAATIIVSLPAPQLAALVVLSNLELSDNRHIRMTAKLAANNENLISNIIVSAAGAAAGEGMWQASSVGITLNHRGSRCRLRLFLRDNLLQD